MQRFTTTTSPVDRALALIGRTNLFLLVSLLITVGVATFVVGIFMEVNGEVGLLKSAGYHALETYRQSASLAGHDMLQRTMLGLTGEHPAFGGNAQVIGMVLAYVGSAAVTTVVLTSRALYQIRIRVSRTA